MKILRSELPYDEATLRANVDALIVAKVEAIHTPGCPAPVDAFLDQFILAIRRPDPDGMEFEPQIEIVDDGVVTA